MHKRQNIVQTTNNAIISELLLADEPLLRRALGVVPGVVHPPQLQAVLARPPRGAPCGRGPPVVVVPDSAVVPEPAALRHGVRGAQPAVVVVTVSREDTRHYIVLHPGADASNVTRVRLACSLSGFVVNLSGSPLITAPGI